MSETQSSVLLSVSVRKDFDDVWIEVRYGARTDVGRRRGHNEDCYGTGFPLFVVADGMGGHKAGEVAASIAVEEMMALADGEDLVAAPRISEAVARAAQRVDELGTGISAPGSTLTGLAMSTHRSFPVARVFNIGDSRTYLLSQGDFQQLTRDHSQVQELIDSGTVTDVEARALPLHNVITRALGAGSGENVLADQFLVPLAAGDRFIMCTDGLSGEVTDSLIEMVSRAVRDPQELADQLVTMALNAGGKDNITVVVVDIVDAGPIFDDIEGEEATQSTGDANENTAKRRGDSRTHDTLPSANGRRSGTRHSGADAGATVVSENGSDDAVSSRNLEISEATSTEFDPAAHDLDKEAIEPELIDAIEEGDEQ